jgi:hypothetical protein
MPNALELLDGLSEELLVGGVSRVLGDAIVVLSSELIWGDVGEETDGVSRR